MLSLEHINKTFGSVSALKNVSFAVEKGEFFSLLGPSGCGKTTLLRVIAGIYQSDTGRIQINGQSVANKPMSARDTAMVFQNYALFPHLSVFDNVAFGLRMRRTPRGELQRRVHEALELVRMTPYAKRLPSELSGGQQQRVAVARAVVVRPSLLLLDEPLSNLDAKLRDEMREELRNLQRELGVTTILVTHDLHEAFAVSDRIAILRNGELSQVGTAKQLYDHPESLFVAGFVGHANLLVGKVAAIEAGTASIDCGGLRISAPAHDLPWIVGDQAWLSLRPERVHINGNGATDGGHTEARVAEVTYLGGLVTVRLDLAGTSLRADMQNIGQPLPAVGDLVRVGWARADVIARPGGSDHAG